jgi:GNAT superfamily N-acetyltransferase
MEPRLLCEADITGAMRLKAAAGWNQTEADWRRVMELPAAAVFGVDCDGQLAATASAVRYGDRLAWIGMVLTHPDFRGRGFARTLLQHTIAWIEARGVDWIKLDATDMGRPLYARLGFADEVAIERWQRPAGAPLATAPELPPVALAEVGQLDAAAFGADRRELLERLAPLGGAAIAGSGYAMGREGSTTAYFGPCVAQETDAARELLAWWLARHPGRASSWDIPLSNEAAVNLARAAGFEPARRLMRMARPGRPQPRQFAHNDSQVFAIAGFEFG